MLWFCQLMIVLWTGVLFSCCGFVNWWCDKKNLLFWWHFKINH